MNLERGQAMTEMGIPALTAAARSTVLLLSVAADPSHTSAEITARLHQTGAAPDDVLDGFIAPLQDSWSTERIPGGYVVGQALAYVYAGEAKADADTDRLRTRCLRVFTHYLVPAYLLRGRGWCGGASGAGQ